MNTLSFILLIAVICLLAFAVWQIFRNLRSSRCCEGGHCAQCPHCRQPNCQLIEERKDR